MCSRNLEERRDKKENSRRLVFSCFYFSVGSARGHGEGTLSGRVLTPRLAFLFLFLFLCLCYITYTCVLVMAVLFHAVSRPGAPGFIGAD